MKKLKNYKFDNIGGLKATIKNYTVSNNTNITNLDFHNRIYNMWFKFGSEKNITIIYKKLIDQFFISDKILNFEPLVLCCGLFINGDKSVLFAIDLNDELYKIIDSDDYFIIKECTIDKIKENKLIYEHLKKYIYE